MRKFVAYVKKQAAARGMGVSIHSPGDGPVRYRFETLNGARDIGPLLKGAHEVEVFLRGWDARVSEEYYKRAGKK